jgi:hypothetical protein
LTGKPIVLNGSTIYVFGDVESIANVTFLIDCYPKPVVSWIQTLGGKLGTWNVIDQKNFQNSIEKRKKEAKRYNVMTRYELIRYNIFKNKVGIQPKFKICISRKFYIKMHCSYNESDYYTMFKNQ